MKPKSKSMPWEAAFGVVLMAFSALLVVLGLQGLVKPARFEARREALEDSLREAAILSRRQASSASYAVCANPDVGAARLRADLIALAVRAQVAIPKLQIQAEPTSGPLAPLQIRFETTGEYPAALRVLGLLQALTPTVFLDTVDLKANKATVTLSFSGRVFCSARV